MSGERRAQVESMTEEINLCSAGAGRCIRDLLPSVASQSCIAKSSRSDVFSVRGELLTIARSGVESLVDLRSRSCPDRDHAKQVLADAEWLSEFRMQHAAQGQHRLHHQDSRADVEVARRFLRAADEFD